MPRTQAHRFLRFTTPLGENALLIRRFVGVEQLGRPFSYSLELVSENHDIPFEKIVGQAVTIHVDNKDGSTRHFNGYVSTFEQVEPEQRKAAYRAVVVPWLWFLTRSADCRVHAETNHKRTTVDIIKAVFDRFPLSNFTVDSLTENYPERWFCVQYRETAFNFVHRLMEEEGIYYYFRHRNGQHTMVLCDSPTAHAPAAEYETVMFNPEGKPKVDMQSIWRWRRTQVVQPGRFEHTDYDFVHPSADLRTKHEIIRPHAASKIEYYDYPGRYYQTGLGDRLAHVRLEEFHAEHDVIHGEGDSRGLQAGRTFTLDKHPRADQNREHLLTSVEYTFTQDVFESEAKPEVKVMAGARPAAPAGGSLLSKQAAHAGVAPIKGGTASSVSGSAVAPATTGGSLADAARSEPEDLPPCICRFTAIEAKTTFRPLRATPKPLVQGPQTATVVGPPGEEIHTDKYGRIKVHFHWDRHNPRESESSSCWIRVSHAWAGPGWGAIYTPRIGQEVIVDFVEGDPDRPIVTGRVYNKERPVPYALPANKTISTLKSHSSKGGGADNFNEIKFEDKKGDELMYVQAEKNRTMLVKNDNSETIGHDETLHVVHDRTKNIDHDETTTVGHDRTETVVNNETITIGVNRTESVGSNETIAIGANRNEIVGDNESVTIGGMRTHTTALATMETVGLAKMLTIGAAYQVTVGAAMNESVGGAKMEETGLYRLMVVGGDMKTDVGGDMDHSVAGKHVMKATEIVLDAGSKIFIQCGASKIILTPSQIEITSPVVKINC